jgi:hypothetical protein
MQRKSIYTAALVTFLLLGAISLAMGQTSDQSNNTSMPAVNNIGNISIPTANTTVPNGLFEATVNNVVSTDRTVLGGNSNSMASLTLNYPNGSKEDIGFVQIIPGSQEANIYNTLNSAYLGEKHVAVIINNYSNGKAMITSVWYMPSKGFFGL